MGGTTPVRTVTEAHAKEPKRGRPSELGFAMNFKVGRGSCRAGAVPFPCVLGSAGASPYRAPVRGSKREISLGEFPPGC